MRRLSLLALTLGLFFLAACSTSSVDEGGLPAAPTSPSQQSPQSPQSPAAAATGEVPQAAPQKAPRGGTLVRLFSDPPTLDPHTATDTSSATIILEVFGGLVTIDPQLNVAPDLAERWDVSPDGTVYTFHLRPDARFHDGKPVTAADVRWSLERATDPAIQSPVVDQYLGDIVGVKEKLRGAAASVAGVRVIDQRTVQITIDAPKSYFLAKLTYPTSFVLDRENVEADPRNWLRNPNGTGPFKLARYDVGETLRLARNDRYHLGPPNLDSVEFILSGGSGMIMYENNEIHLTGVGLADRDRVLDPASPLQAEVHQAPPAFRVDYIGLNVTRPPLDDRKVRQALSLTINKEDIAEKVLANLVTPAYGILPPGFPGYNPDLRGHSFNPERARQLLRESKYGADLDNLPPIVLTTQGSFGASVGLDLEVIIQSWEQELGITVEIQQTEFATYLNDLHNNRFQMFEGGWVADYPDPENFLDILFHSQSNNNNTSYANLQVDALLEQARVERDREIRFQLYHRIEQMIVDDAAWIPVWYTGEQTVLLKPQLKDYYLSPLVIPKLRHVYFSDE